jgi:hypothetical protein
MEDYDIEATLLKKPAQHDCKCLKVCVAIVICASLVGTAAYLLSRLEYLF